MGVVHHRLTEDGSFSCTLILDQNLFPNSLSIFKTVWLFAFYVWCNFFPWSFIKGGAWTCWTRYFTFGFLRLLATLTCAFENGFVWDRVSVLARIRDQIGNRDRRIVGNFRQKIHIVIVGSSVRFSQKNHIHDRRIVGKNISNDRRIVGKNNQKSDRRIVGKGWSSDRR